MKHFYNFDEFIILDGLKKQISKSGNIIKENYRYLHKGKLYIFDLVELDAKGNILKIYEIKPKSAIPNNSQFIIWQFNLLKKITNAEVYLVYIDDNRELKIQNSSDLLPATMQEAPKVADSFSTFYECIKDICHNEGNYFFRGHSDHTYKAIPSIYRNNNIQNESSFYHEAIRKCPKEFTEDMSTFDKLVKMQHYELPTRLLDITTNPLIALFFACQGKENVDGEILVYSMDRDQIKYYDEDPISILSNLAKCPANFTFSKNKKELVSYIQQDKPNFKGDFLEASDVEKNVLCVLPKLNNKRIIRQHGAFFIFGMGKSKDAPAALLNDPSRIRIKSTAKKKILEELEMLGINEAELFPETDKIMNHIKKQYIKE